MLTGRRVAILLCTFEGERFLREQLASIAGQSHTPWFVVASDDGSTDGTIGILGEFAAAHPGRVDLRRRNGDGSATRHFLSLACDTGIEADFFAFCDQDDVWLPHKLARAIELLDNVTGDQPTAYGARTVIIDEQGQHCGHSPLFSHPPSFRNALVQSIAGGNSIVFNRPARDLLASAGVADAASHDWWTYQLVTGAGGRFIYDPVPTVHYRQHATNVIGANLGWRARRTRLAMMLGGRFLNWRRQNVRALMDASHLLVPDAKRRLELLGGLDHRRAHKRIQAIARSGVYRQTVAGWIGLYAAALLGRT